ncbi:M20 metallopeptidase family protein [Nigerium massiliense]|uniref:M20 metallopeptidase family protein n=1 Tax=Nigerium massiliense TaxID=1522317 RepID=UPI00058F2977|nr:M20 family metallopeptidase [Nigerium massiliense]
MTSASDLLDQLTAGIDRVQPEARKLRRLIHRHPFVGGEEAPTRQTLHSQLDWLSWRPVAGTGMYGRLGPDGPAIGLRAELDALPVQERTGLDWASARPGVMHACGHDVHMAALWSLLQAAQGVELPVAMVPVFQPREEISPSGANDVCSAGVLEEHDIRAMLGVHVQPRVPAGVISTGAGAVNAAFDEFHITVHGQPGHGAYPHVSLDPIGILATIITGLGDLAGRSIDPTHPTVISVGKIGGGTAPNVIAGSASCMGTVRTTNDRDREQVHAEIRRLAELSAAARGATADVRVVTGGAMLYNDDALVHVIDPLIEHTGVRLARRPFRSCGSDDFSAYCERIPSVMMFAGTGTPAAMTDRVQVGLHHERYLPDEEAIRLAAYALACGYVGAVEMGRPRVGDSD